MKRLKKMADHDADSRDSALVIVGDNIYENATHALCLNDIYKEIGKKLYINLQCRPEIEQFEIISDNKKTSVILAHRVNNDYSIYYFYGYDNGEQMSDKEIENKLKKIFPRYDIKNDLEHELTPEEMKLYDSDMQLKKMQDTIDKETKERGNLEDEFKNMGFIKYNEECLTNYSCIVLDSGAGLFVDRMPDYLQNFKNIDNYSGEVKPQYINDFLEAIKSEKPSEIGLLFRNYGYEINDGSNIISFYKTFNDIEVGFMLNHKTNKFDIDFVSDFDAQDYLEQALKDEFGSYENINIDKYTLDFIDEKLNSYCSTEIQK